MATLLCFLYHFVDRAVVHLDEVPYQHPSSPLVTAGNPKLAQTDTCPTHPYYLPPEQLSFGGTSLLARAPVALTLACAAGPRSNLALFSCCCASYSSSLWSSFSWAARNSARVMTTGPRAICRTPLFLLVILRLSCESPFSISTLSPSAPANSSPASFFSVSYVCVYLYV